MTGNNTFFKWSRIKDFDMHRFRIFMTKTHKEVEDPVYEEIKRQRDGQIRGGETSTKDQKDGSGKL